MPQWLSKQKDHHIVVLDKNGVIYKDTITLNEKIDIVLLPSFYWFIEKKLPVKFTFQTKEYLPSIFESLTTSAKLSYLAIKKEDFYWLFAYDDQEILKALEKENIDISKVERVYFAQNVFNDMAIDLENNYSLVNIDGILTRIPSTLVSGSKKISQISKNDFNLTKGISLKRYKSFIGENFLYKLITPLVLIILLYIIDTAQIWHTNKNLLQQKNEIFSKYNLPNTTFQNRSILAQLENTYKVQKNLRNLIKTVMSAPYSPNEFITSFKINQKNSVLCIKLENPSDANIFKNYFEQKLIVGNIKSMSVHNSILTVEFNV